MTPGEVVVLTMIIAAFIAFAATLAWYSREPRAHAAAKRGSRVAARDRSDLQGSAKGRA